MAVKAINDSIGLDGIVLTLLVFRVYLRLIDDLVLVSITKRVEVIYIITKDI